MDCRGSNEAPPKGWQEEVKPNSTWLHLGSGDYYSEGWCNVDLRDGVKLDYFADAFDLPFPDQSFDRLYLGHFLEHIPLECMAPLGDSLRRVMQPGAEVCVVGPCLGKCVTTNQPHWLLEQMIAQGHGIGGHHWTASTEVTSFIMSTYLSIGDHREVPVGTIVQPTWPNPHPQGVWQCAFLGRFTHGTDD